jgi:serine/threonine protein kinase
MFESLELPDLPKRQCEILRKPSSTRPTLWKVEEDGRKAVVKDYSTNRFLYRNTIGRFLVWRECKAYRMLEGLKGVPTFYCVIDGLAIVIEEISGRNMEDFQDDQEIPKGFFQELKNLVKSIHEHGLAHCDLKRAPNILLGDDGRPYIVDWSSSISRREFRFSLLNLIYNKLIMDDFNAIIKIQLRLCPETVSFAEKRRYYNRSEAEKFVRLIRDKARDLLQRIA